MKDILDVFEKCPEVDILSPNVLPSNIAFKIGEDSDKPYRPSKIVGGLWFMRRRLVDGMDFTKYSARGIHGAFEVLNQIL